MIPRMQRPCLEPGCGRLAPPGKGRCIPHTRQQQATHNASHTAYRDPAYQSARRAQLVRVPYCIVQLVAATPCKGALTVHHVDHDASNNATDNLTTLCMHHHMRLEATYQKGGGTALDELAEAIDGDT